MSNSNGKTSEEKIFRWVKASERLPEIGDLYHTNIRMRDSGEETFPSHENFYDGEWQISEAYEVIEWLEEYTPSKEEGGADWKKRFQNWYLHPNQDWQKDGSNPKYVPYMYIERWIENYLIPSLSTSSYWELVAEVAGNLISSVPLAGGIEAAFPELRPIAEKYYSLLKQKP
jgi:hypothetical protein